MLLTRRSTALRNHAGEISFPGGRIDPGETAVAAALREADEEVGLDPAAVEVVGELDHLTTVVSRSHIVPVVAPAAAQLALAPAVAGGRAGPVGAARRARCAPTPTAPSAGRAPGLGGAQDPERVLHFFELDDETVWGATAHMLVDLLWRVGGVQPPDR